jgi:hypothetical protein
MHLARGLCTSFGVMKMRFLQRLKLRFSPPRLVDPDFGEILFMYIPNAPERSYWECEWRFPKTGDVVSIALPGTESGPLPESRIFFLALSARFESILAAVRPKLSQVFRSYLDRDLPDNLFSELRLAGFSLENPKASPVAWDIAFETTGERWLGIAVPFVGDCAQEPTVDT